MDNVEKKDMKGAIDCKLNEVTKIFNIGLRRFYFDKLA